MKDQPFPTVVRCRERRQDVAPTNEGLVYQHPQRCLLVGARSSVHAAGKGLSMTGSVAGIDWASEKHDVLIADAAGERLLAETFAHDERGFTLCATR
jgi:hypothetical protein